MKFVIILSIIAVTLAKEYEMNVEENGEKVREKVIIDVAGNTEEFKVPKHGNRAELDMLNDFNVGYSARKVKADSSCYISVISKEQTPSQMEVSMEKSHARFQEDSYMVTKEKFVRLYKMEASEVGAKIAAHCTGYDMIFTATFKKDSDVLNIVKSVAKRTKRSLSGGFLDYTGCHGDTGIPQRCIGHRPPKVLFTRCRMLTRGSSSCVYNIKCRLVDYKWSCNSKHNFHLPFCCKLDC